MESEQYKWTELFFRWFPLKQFLLSYFYSKKSKFNEKYVKMWFGGIQTFLHFPVMCGERVVSLLVCYSRGHNLWDNPCKYSLQSICFLILHFMGLFGILIGSLKIYYNSGIFPTVPFSIVLLCISNYIEFTLFGVSSLLWFPFKNFERLFELFMPGLHSCPGNRQDFGKMWTRRSTHECRHSHSRVRIIDNEARHSCFPWLGTDLPTCLRELRDEMRTGRECEKQDKCTLHTLVLVCAVSMRM